MANPKKLLCANGALLEIPVFEPHERGSNWLAVIGIDGSMPGGLSREWIERGKGSCHYLTDKLSLFDAVEFGADYKTSTGAKRPKRWYGVIVGKTEDYLLVEQAADGARAVLASKAKRVDPGALADALEAQADALLARADRLRADAAAVRGGASFETFESYASKLIDSIPMPAAT